MFVIISFIVFLFVLYLLSREDFVFLRRNVSLEEIFNITFLTSIVALLVARIAYVAFHPKIGYFNPLVFFLIPYFPGLAVTGGIVGSIIFLWFITRKKKFPTGRIFDVFSLSYFFAFSVYVVLQGSIQLVTRHFLLGGIAAGLGIIAFFLAVLLSRLFAASTWRDGSICLWTITFVSLVSLVSEMLSILDQKKVTLNPEGIIFVLLLLFALIFAVKGRVMGRVGK
jgi:hypothetical protein